jgi:hypothetical protein
VSNFPKRLVSEPAAGAIPFAIMRNVSRWPVTISGKLANGCTDQLEGWGDYVAMLRRGADAARFLADELDRVSAREEGNNQ